MAKVTTARFRITTALLFQDWPADMQVLAARVAESEGIGILEFAIFHPGLQWHDLPEGAAVPWCHPHFTRKEQGAIVARAVADLLSAFETEKIQPAEITMARAGFTIIVERAIREAARVNFEGWGQDDARDQPGG